MKTSKNNLKDWVGNSETRNEVIFPQPLQGFSALMDEEGPVSEILPAGCHWLYFLPKDRQSNLAEDGHSRKGSFLPPVKLPRRMWAGGRLSFTRPIRTGDAIEKTSTILSVEEKEGRSGKLVFVTVEHLLKKEGAQCVREEHDIVFREAAKEGDPTPEPTAAPIDFDWEKTIVPDPVMLFRYSALTFNGHRIHYDRDYVTNVEGYPGLVVHGPLIGTLLMKLASDNMGSKSLKTFEFRNSSPIYDIAPFRICGKKTSDSTCDVWAVGPHGELAVKATAKF